MRKWIIKITCTILVCLISLLTYAQNGDLDGDGVLDKDDVCPSVVGSKSNRGCPLEKNENLTSSKFPISGDTVALFDTRALEMKDLVDIKQTDIYYEPLKSLTERWGVVTAFSDHSFRPNEPLTRIQFAYLLDYILNRLREVFNDEFEDNWEYILLQSYDAHKNMTNEITSLTDITTKFPYYLQLQSLQERHNILIGDEDKYFRPNKQMTEQDFFSAISAVFVVDYSEQFDDNKLITRGASAIALNDVLNYKVKQCKEPKKTVTEEKIELINKLPSLGTVKIIDEDLHLSNAKDSYSMNAERCTDFTKASVDVEKAARHGGVRNDTYNGINKNDVVDIIYEFTSKCNADKLVMVRKGTIISIFYEKGIKRLK